MPATNLSSRRRLGMTGVAKGLVTLGGFTNKAAVSTVMIHAVLHHVIDLRTITEIVGKNHGTNNRMVGASRSNTRGCGHGSSLGTAAAAARGRVDGRSARASEGSR